LWGVSRSRTNLRNQGPDHTKYAPGCVQTSDVILPEITADRVFAYYALNLLKHAFF
jgi:hypothetical protein